jgi:hypothetical protein
MPCPACLSELVPFADQDGRNFVGCSDKTCGWVGTQTDTAQPAKALPQGSDAWDDLFRLVVQDGSDD